MTFQEMIATLTRYWSAQGCLVHQGYDLEVGAGTFNPATFLRCLGPEPYSAVYVEPSRRPQDGRYGQNPNRMQFYFQMQVILKPAPANIVDLFLNSLESVGLKLKEHDMRLVHDDWENPTIGASGLGWEIWSDGMEVTQFTYFQTLGGLSVKPVSGEITYGLERLAMYLQQVDSVWDIKWNDELTYGDIYRRSEWEWSFYNFEASDSSMWLKHFSDFEAEAKRLLKNNLPIPAYDFVMKASHAFNMLDARGVISVTERVLYIAKIRELAKQVAEVYIKSREEANYPLLKKQKTTPVKTTFFNNCSEFSAQEREDFLLEIGSEELPATFVPIGLQNLKNKMEALLNEYSLPYDEIKLYGTPRRLTVHVTGLAAGVAGQKIEKKGPPVHSSFEADGKPTKAGIGFFRSVGIEPMSLESAKNHSLVSIRSLQGVDYLFAIKETAPVSTRELLSNLLPKLILDIDFPKKMRWGSLDIEYARPLKWFVCLYGKEILYFELAGLLSGRTSRGHRLLSDQAIEISHPKDYLKQLKDHYVLADVDERRTLIEHELSKFEKKHHATALEKAPVMNQVLHLVEYPMLMCCSFDPNFLRAPAEVLTSEMVEHQKYFPLAKEDGSLIPHFVVVCNNHPSRIIGSGHEKALSSRLADGVFLFDEDCKTPMEEFQKKLYKITFQKELGSIGGKSDRLGSYVQVLHRFLPLCSLEKLQRAAFLCKADLASNLVREFPDLQGKIGSLYARIQGEDAEVASAIDEHWMPRREKGPFPQTACGTILSLAEKIDNLLSCYALGLIPTSSSDPFALRRQALGLIKMIIDGGHYLPLHDLLHECFAIFVTNPELSTEKALEFEAGAGTIIQQIEQFLNARLRTVLMDEGFAKDEIEAVLAHGLQDIYDTYKRVLALHEFRQKQHPQFLTILALHTRIKKILLSQKPQLLPEYLAARLHIPDDNRRFPKVNSSLCKERPETLLLNQAQSIKQELHTQLLNRRTPEGRNYSDAFSLLASFEKNITTLFDTVKVVDDDPHIRTNRLALLQEVYDLFEEVIDFGKLQEHTS